jgi:hypothetical protein
LALETRHTEKDDLLEVAEGRGVLKPHCGGY